MAEPAEIVEAALDAALAANLPASTAVTPLSGAPEPAGVGPDLDRSGSPRTQRLAGRRVVVTAGGTREPLDPVRFLGNRSSGRQGVAIAEVARDLGAEVTLVAANLEVPDPAGVTVVQAGTAEELLAATTAAARDADLVVMCAAVADYRPAATADRKLKKRDTGERLTLELVQNPDVLRELVARRAESGPAGQVLVGFAAETEGDPERLLALGREKIAAKGCDYLVLNEVGWTAGFGAADTAVTVIDRAGDSVGSARGDKVSVALRILDLVA
jgi:phosphopantothenoylcysteine decarboxylase/phosphopantothenate--cysteine ligase